MWLNIAVREPGWRIPSWTTSKRISDEVGTYDQIDVKAAAGTTPAALANGIRQIAPATTDVRLSRSGFRSRLVHGLACARSSSTGSCEQINSTSLECRRASSRSRSWF